MALIQGLVIRSVGSQYTVKTETGSLQATLKGKLRLQESQATNPVVVGDWVELEKQDVWTISNIRDRTNKISRTAIGNENMEHVIAANVDQMIVLSSIRQPTLRLQFIDRCLASAEAFRIPVILIISKMDLIKRPGDVIDELTNVYNQAVDSLLFANLLDPLVVNSILPLIQGKISVLAGLSGVGKSTLVKTVNPSLPIRIGETSKKWEQGKHTTSFAELHEIIPGSFLIDTPGLREFSLFNIEAWELSHFFREMVPFLDGCKYSKCSHTHEPVCAVKDAVENGTISPNRYDSYLKMYDDLMEREKN